MECLSQTGPLEYLSPFPVLVLDKVRQVSVSVNQLQYPQLVPNKSHSRELNNVLFVVVVVNSIHRVLLWTFLIIVMLQNADTLLFTRINRIQDVYMSYKCYTLFNRDLIYTSVVDYDQCLGVCHVVCCYRRLCVFRKHW